MIVKCAFARCEGKIMLMGPLFERVERQKVNYYVANVQRRPLLQFDFQHSFIYFMSLLFYLPLPVKSKEKKIPKVFIEVALRFLT